MGLLDEIKNNLDQDFFDMDKYRAEQAAKEAAEAEKAEKENAEKPAQVPEEQKTEEKESKPETVPEEKTAQESTAEVPSPEKKKKKKKKRKNNEKAEKELNELKEAFDNALDEDLSNFDEFRDMSEDVSVTVRKPTFKRNVYFATGILVSLMALIGFAFSVAYIMGLIGNIANNTKQKETFKEIVYPLVISDTAGFESISDLSGDTLLSAAIWDLILYEDTSVYPYEFGNITVPQADIELHATQMFGEGLTFNHRTIGDISLTFYYNEDTKSYIIPVSPDYFTYTPVVEEVKKTGDTYKIMVGYLSPTPSWRLMREEEEHLCDKYLEYTLKKSGDRYIIVSARVIEGAGIGDKYE